MKLSTENIQNIIWALLDNSIRGGAWLEETKILLEMLPHELAKTLLTNFLNDWVKSDVYNAIEQGWISQDDISKWIDVKEEILN